MSERCLSNTETGPKTNEITISDGEDERVSTARDLATQRKRKTGFSSKVNGPLIIGIGVGIVAVLTLLGIFTAMIGITSILFF